MTCASIMLSHFVIFLWGLGQQPWLLPIILRDRFELVSAEPNLSCLLEKSI